MLKKGFFSFFLGGLRLSDVFFLFCLGGEAYRLGTASLYRAALRRAALDRGRVLLGLTVAAALGRRPLLQLEVLLCRHAEGEVLRAAVAVDEDGLHALVHDGAVVAPLGLVPPLLLEDTGLAVREEEHDLAIAAGELLSRRLGLLLSLATLGAARRLRPVVLGEESLVLAREGEGARAVAARELDVLRERRALGLGAPPRALGLATASGLLVLGGLRGSSLCLHGSALRLELLLEASDTLVGPCEELADLGRIFTDADAAEQVVAVNASLENNLVSCKRHLGLGV
jgi:hypothetical protein